MYAIFWIPSVFAIVNLINEKLHVILQNTIIKILLSTIEHSALLYFMIRSKRYNSQGENRANLFLKNTRWYRRLVFNKHELYKPWRKTQTILYQCRRAGIWPRRCIEHGNIVFEIAFYTRYDTGTRECVLCARIMRLAALENRRKTPVR